MTRQFVVIKAFKDLEDNNHVYKGGHFYPREGTELDEARADVLVSSDNKQGKPLIVEVLPKSDVEETEPQEIEQEDAEVVEQEEYPHHTGGGYYTLSNGEKVQGKDAAVEAEKALQE